MTIHQPTTRILGILDSVLSRGRTMYAGTPAGLNPFFAEFGAPVSDNENLDEFMLDIVREYEHHPDGAAHVKWQHRSSSSVDRQDKDSSSLGHRCRVCSSSTPSPTRGACRK
jgi:hypothetical protein